MGGLEKITIVAMPRDKFSTMEICLRNIQKHTPEPHELWVISGGTPASLRQRWEQRLAGKARFTFLPEFQNGAQMRNLALESIPTRLAVFVDSDVYVRPGWLAPLLECQAQTGAAMVAPMILDRDNRVHTAGNDFFITHQNGRAYASMALRYQHQKVLGPTNLTRRENDFCEVHCQLVVVETAKRYRIYDENLRELQEMDSGLTLSKNGCRMFFEPRSEVYLYYSQLVKEPADIPFYLWKWDMKALRDGFDYFYRKWGLDVNENDSFGRYLQDVNNRVGFFSRRWPSGTSVALDKALMSLKIPIR